MELCVDLLLTIRRTLECPRCLAPGATLTPILRTYSDRLDCPECSTGRPFTHLDRLNRTKPTRMEIQLRRKAHVRWLRAAERRSASSAWCAKES